MTTLGRLRRDRGGIVMTDFEIPVIEKAPESSLFASQVMNHTRKIDVNEVQMFKEDNIESIVDRQLECISRVPYGINKGAGMNYGGMMNTALLPTNWGSQVHSQNPYKAFVDGYFRPIVRAPIEVNRPMDKQPNRHILAEGKVNRDITLTSGLLADPPRLRQQFSVENRSGPIKSRDYIERQETNKKLRDSNNVSVSSVPTLNVSGDQTIPFIPDYILKESTPITISANPSLGKEMINTLEVLDLREGSSYRIRETLPTIIGTRYQIKVYDQDSRQYIPVHQKDNPFIIAEAQAGKNLNLSVGDDADSKTIKLKDYRMTAFLAPSVLPVLIIEPWTVPARTKEYRAINADCNINKFSTSSTTN